MESSLIPTVFDASLVAQLPERCVGVKEAEKNELFIFRDATWVVSKIRGWDYLKAKPLVQVSNVPGKKKCAPQVTWVRI